MQHPTPADPEADQLAAARRDWEARKRSIRLSMIVLSITATAQWMIFFQALPAWMQEHSDGILAFPHMAGILAGALTATIAISCIPDGQPHSALRATTRVRYILLLIFLTMGGGVLGAMALGDALEPTQPVSLLTGVGYALCVGLIVHHTDPYPPSLK